MSTDLKRDNSGHTANWAVAERHPLQDLCEGTGHQKVADPQCISLYHAVTSYSSKMGYLMVDMHHPTTVSFIYCQPSVVRYGFADRIPACQRRATEQIGMQE